MLIIRTFLQASAKLSGDSTSIMGGDTTIVSDWEHKVDGQQNRQKWGRKASILGVFGHRRSTVHPLAALNTEDEQNWFDSFPTTSFVPWLGIWQAAAAFSAL